MNLKQKEEEICITHTKILQEICYQEDLVGTKSSTIGEIQTSLKHYLIRRRVQMSKRERQAYYRGVKNTIQFLLVSGFYTYLLCEIVAKIL